MRKIGFFGLSGGTAFVIDLLMMFILSHFFSPLLTRGIAVVIAASSSWWMNRKLTFRSENRAQVEWLQFLLVSSIGFIPNWSCYWLMMSFDNPMLNWPTHYAVITENWQVVAIVPGIILGTISNFVLASRFVFTNKLSRST